MKDRIALRNSIRNSTRNDIPNNIPNNIFFVLFISRIIPYSSVLYMFYRISRFLEDEGMIFDVNKTKQYLGILLRTSYRIPFHLSRNISRNELPVGLRWDVTYNARF